MNRIIKPGDSDFHNPAEKSPPPVPVAMFHKAGKCTNCGMPIFVHTELPGDGMRIYRTCNCEDPKPSKLRIMNGYNPQAERESLDYLFKVFELYLVTIEELQNANSEATSGDLDGAGGDRDEALPEQGEGSAG